MGGDLRNHAHKLLNFFRNLLQYRRKLSQCQNMNIFHFQAGLSLQERGRMSHSFLNQCLTKGACGWGPQKSCSEASETFWKSSPLYKEAK